MADVQKVLEALGSPIRREILWLLWDAELPAGRIAAAFDLSAPTISEHLHVLRDAGLVDVRPEGTFRHYRARRDALRAVQQLLYDESAKWVPVVGAPGVERAVTSVERAVRATIDVPLSRATTFAAWTDATTFSAWLGVPVALTDGRFRCTTEFGTRVRGTYDVVVAPALLALQWDFEDDAVPVPGRELTSYVRFDDTEDGTRVDVVQPVGDDHEAAFMQVAWAYVLGRLQAWAERSAD
jgi:DNA-binding transcriptional ArsR family regulator